MNLRMGPAALVTAATACLFCQFDKTSCPDYSIYLLEIDFPLEKKTAFHMIFRIVRLYSNSLIFSFLPISKWMGMGIAVGCAGDTFAYTRIVSYSRSLRSLGDTLLSHYTSNKYFFYPSMFICVTIFKFPVIGKSRKYRH